MALIKCKECRGIISDTTSFCPKCGAPIPHSPDDKVDRTEIIPDKHVETSTNKIVKVDERLSVPVQTVEAKLPTGAHKATNKILLFIILLLAIGLLVVLVYLYFDITHKKELPSDHLEQANIDSIASVNEAIEMSVKAHHDSIEQQTQLEAQRQGKIDFLNNAKDNFSQILRRPVQAHETNDHNLSSDNFTREYFLLDINKDGIPELWVRSGTCMLNEMMSVYQLDGNSVKMILNTEAGHCGFAKGSNYIIKEMAHQDWSEVSKITYSGGKLKEAEIYEGPSEDYDSKGKYIDEFEASNQRELERTFNYLISKI